MTERLPPWLRGPAPVLIAVVALGAAQALGGYFPYLSYMAMLVGINVVLAVSLNIVNGMTGQFSIGHAGFMAVGAYTAGKLSTWTGTFQGSEQLFFLGSILLGGTFAAACGFAVGLPSLRLKGDYLAIVTLGFGEIVRVIIQVTPDVNELTEQTRWQWPFAMGGSLALADIPRWSSVFMVWFWVFITVLVARRLAGSAHGRSLWAIREDEIAAEAMGVNTTGYKVRAFVVSSFFAGVAGALFAHLLGSITPGRFDFLRSMEIVVMVVAGGLGSTTGAVVAAVALTLLPEGLRTVFTQADQVRKPLYGILLVALMLVRPQGLFGTREVWDVLPRWVRARRAT